MANIEDFDAQVMLDKAQEKFDDNKNYIYIALAAIIVIVGGFWWYNSNQETKSTEANAMLWKLDESFENGDYESAINGKTDVNGFKGAGYATIADQYSGTKSGEIAAYNLGVSYLNQGKFAEAINALEGVYFSDVVLGAVAKGALGDAYFELGEVDNAISSYSDAVSHSDNEFTTPIYLKKLAIAQESVKDFKDAIQTYTKLKEDYSTSPEAKGVDKFIALLENK